MLCPHLENSEGQKMVLSQQVPTEGCYAHAVRVSPPTSIRPDQKFLYRYIQFVS